jgi:hypothetical protein
MMILEGWRDAIWAGRHTAVRYDCASPSVARWIARLAKRVGLTGSDFTAVVQTTAEEIAALSPVAPDDQPAIDAAMPSGEPSGHLASRPKPHLFKRQHRGHHCKSHRPSHHRRRNPKRPRPRRSANVATARSSAVRALGWIPSSVRISPRPLSCTATKLWPVDAFCSQRQQRREGSFGRWWRTAR